MDWTGERERLEEIEGLLERIRASSGEEGFVVVVEGERDREALRELDVKGRFVLLSSSGSPLADQAAEIYRREGRALLLPDWDRPGSDLESRFAELLHRFGVEVDRETRSRLGALVRKDISEVEELPALVRRLREETGGENVYCF